MRQFYFLILAAYLSIISCAGDNGPSCFGDILLPDLSASLEATGLLRLGQPFQLKVRVANQKAASICERDVHQPVTEETLTAISAEYRAPGSGEWVEYKFGSSAGSTFRLLLNTPPPVDCPGDEHESVVSASVTLYDVGEYRFGVTADYTDVVEEREENNNFTQKTLN